MKKWLVITGPTASGKTKLAVKAAALFDGEVISIDSRQVFKSMDIGTGKDLADYEQNGVKIPYHLIDIVNPGDDYHLTAFQEDFNRVITDMSSRQKVPVLCGGSGLYLEAVLENHTFTSIPVHSDLRAILREKPIGDLKGQYLSGQPLPFQVDKNNKKRLIRAIEMQHFLEKNPGFTFPKYQPHEQEIFIIDLPREIRRERISARLKSRLEHGLVDEVKHLRSVVSDETLIRYGLEYKYVTFFLQGHLSLSEMTQKLETEIHRFSKRQMTWFRRLAKNNPKVHWLDGTMPADQLLDQITAHY